MLFRAALCALLLPYLASAFTPTSSVLARAVRRPISSLQAVVEVGSEAEVRQTPSRPALAAGLAGLYLKIHSLAIVAAGGHISVVLRGLRRRPNHPPPTPRFVLVRRGDCGGSGEAGSD
jgi:hypothetical protein